MLPLMAATAILAALGGCATPEEKAWDSFGSLMDRTFGQGRWTAESHSFSGGTLTVNGIKASVPPSLESYLASRAAASAKVPATANAPATAGAGEARSESPAGSGGMSADTGATLPSMGNETPTAGERAPVPGDEALGAGEGTPALGDAAQPPNDVAPTAANGAPTEGDGSSAPGPGDETMSAGHFGSDVSDGLVSGADGAVGAASEAGDPSAPSAGDPDTGDSETAMPATDGPDAAADGTNAPSDDGSIGAEVEAGSSAADGQAGDADAAEASASAADGQAGDADAAEACASAADGQAGDADASEAGAAAADGQAGDADAAEAGASAADGQGADAEASPPLEARPAGPPGDPNVPADDRPGLTLRSVKVTGLATAERLAAASGNSGKPLDVFASLEIEDLRLHTGSSPDGSLDLLLPSASLGRLSCGPGPVRPACALDFLISGEGSGFEFVLSFPESDLRSLLAVKAAAFSAEGLSADGAGHPLLSLKAAQARAWGLEIVMPSRDLSLTLGASAGEFCAEGLEGLYSAESTAIARIGAYLNDDERTLWQASADAFSADGLDLREALSGDSARPGASLMEAGPPRSAYRLAEALWPAWDSLVRQGYSAASWALEGFDTRVADGPKLTAGSIAASGPFVRGKLSSSAIQVSGAELTVPVDGSGRDFLRKATDFLGGNTLRGDLAAKQTWNPEEGALRWRLEPLDIRELGRFNLDLSLTGMSEAAADAMAGVPLRDAGRLFSVLPAQGLGIGGLELSLSGRSVVDRTVLAVADSLEKPPSAALAEMTSRVSMTLLYFLSNYASLDSVMGVSEAIIGYIESPQVLTLALAPDRPLDAAALNEAFKDPGAVVELLKVSVSSNGGLPQPLEP
jgi:hypothetical protein